VVGAPARRLRINALKAHLAKVELLDEGLYYPHRIVFTDVVIDTVGQQTHLGSVRPFDESLHAVGLASCGALFYSSWRVFTQSRPISDVPNYTGAPTWSLQIFWRTSTESLPPKIRATPSD
jgi:hypothetical protein